MSVAGFGYKKITSPQRHSGICALGQGYMKRCDARLIAVIRVCAIPENHRVSTGRIIVYGIQGLLYEARKFTVLQCGEYVLNIRIVGFEHLCLPAHLRVLPGWIVFIQSDVEDIIPFINGSDARNFDELRPRAI